MEYKVIAIIPLHDLGPKVTEYENGVNDVLAEANVQERVQVSTELHVMTMTVSREIERQEEVRIVELLRAQLRTISGLENCAVSLRKSSSKSSE